MTVEVHSAVAIVRGHELYFDTDIGWWRYLDNGDLLGDPDWIGSPWLDGQCYVGDDLVRFPDPLPPARACIECHRMPTPEGHDPCIANLPNVIAACCGHGNRHYAYQRTAEDVERRRREMVAEGLIDP